MDSKFDYDSSLDYGSCSKIFIGYTSSFILLKMVLIRFSHSKNIVIENKAEFVNRYEPILCNESNS